MTQAIAVTFITLAVIAGTLVGLWWIERGER